jgi:phytoene dehydrogenase-like protein
VAFAALAYQSMAQMLRQYGLHDNARFVAFVNEQLLITAQNYVSEVNVLFGATALCYTQFTNYYMPGGLINLVNPMVAYLRAQGGELHLRTRAEHITRTTSGYEVTTPEDTWEARQVICAIPANNAVELFDDPRIKARYQHRLLDSSDLYSAFQMGAVVRKRREMACIHHQIHLTSPLPGTGSHSIFLSLSHPDDTQRCGPDEMIASVSTHIRDPKATFITDKTETEAAIWAALEAHDLLHREDLIYQHSSTPRSWKKWTGRAWGFVGGYPQYMRIKPWQMLDHRLDHRGAYLCGDSTYPGQGIPGACLSGIVAWQKMQLDSHSG